jgi:hypothetical protein
MRSFPSSLSPTTPQTLYTWLSQHTLPLYRTRGLQDIIVHSPALVPLPLHYLSSDLSRGSGSWPRCTHHIHHTPPTPSAAQYKAPQWLIFQSLPLSFALDLDFESRSHKPTSSTAHGCNEQVGCGWVMKILRWVLHSLSTSPSSCTAASDPDNNRE